MPALPLDDPFAAETKASDSPQKPAAPLEDPFAGETAAEAAMPALPAEEDVFSASVPAAAKTEADWKGLEPTYILACLRATDGKVVWRRWIDGDCISAASCGC